MPIYEYRCTKCGHEWSQQELLAEHSRDRSACPKCGAAAEQVFSAFFAKTIRKS
jgi:putative FmdB family regulatory protein